MYTLFIGGVAFVGLIFLIGKKEGDVSTTSWGKVEKIEQDIQQAKDKVLCWGFYSAF
jgi:hypothetical protein